MTSITLNYPAYDRLDLCENGSEVMDDSDNQESEYRTDSNKSAEDNDHCSSDDFSVRISDFCFATVIEKCGTVLLEKGKTPALKVMKKLAIINVIDFIKIEKRIELEEKQIMKKINNMKDRIRKKTDRTATGNKKIKLNTREEKTQHSAISL